MWICYMVEFNKLDPAYWRELKEGSPLGYPLHWRDLKPGAMWYQSGRLVVKLPSGAEWDLDIGRLTNRAQGSEYPEWETTGFPPEITAIPEINHEDHYRGTLKDGILSADLDGRIEFSRETVDQV